ncbi:MAG: SAM-dependent methyltransferase [Halobacteriales archaeon]|nr:SAM-dependent methyltransferase [Halobacteriales archaeon]
MDYKRRADEEGYRARSAYKLRQIDDEFGVLSEGDTVVDIGAAPGSWTQVVSERVGAEGRVVGVDLAPVTEFKDGEVGADTETTVEFLQGDITEDETKERVEEAVGDGGANAVVCDASPDISGEWTLDHARSIHIARNALDVARRVLVPGGYFVVKVFQGDTTNEFRDEVRDAFEDVATYTPDASRDESSEVYVVGLGRVDAPVSVGDTFEAEVVGEGDEGDGIIRIDGYVLFVEDTSEGETVKVRVTELTPRFGRAETV